MRALVIAVASLALSVAAVAEPKWTSPAWYQVADTVYGWVLLAGPFADQQSCQATLPANDDEADYMCQYLNERPSYDD